MHIQNLSIVFGPTLMWPDPEKAMAVNLQSKMDLNTRQNYSDVNYNSNSKSNFLLTAQNPSLVGNSKLMSGMANSLVNGMIEQMKSNKVVEFLLTEYDSLFRN